MFKVSVSSRSPSSFQSSPYKVPANSKSNPNKNAHLSIQKTLFFATVIVTLALNIIFLFATKDKPPDPTTSTTTLVSVIQLGASNQAAALVSSSSSSASSSSSSSRRPNNNEHFEPFEQPGRRLFLRSNDFYDYSPAVPLQVAAAENPAVEHEDKSSQVAESRRHLTSRSNGHVEEHNDEEENEIGPPEKHYAASTTTTDGQRSGTKNSNIEGATQSGGRGRLASAPAASQTLGDQKRERDNNESSNDNENTSANEITTTARSIPSPSTGTPTSTSATNTLNIRVKSSKNHVLIKVDNLIIYESGRLGDNAKQQLAAMAKQGGEAPEDTKPTAFSRRRSRHRHARRRHRSPPNDKNTSEPVVRQSGPSERGHELDSAASSALEARRGIHVLVLNQFEGFVMSRRVFDTYSPQQDDELALYLSQIQEGRLLVLAVQDEASFKMGRSSQARKLIERSLGSRLIHQLGWRDMWALVAVKQLDRMLDKIPDEPLTNNSNLNLAEGLERSPSFSEWAQPVELEALFRLRARTRDDEDQECQIGAQDPPEVGARRRHFCARIEGYGPLCDCRHPSQLHFEHSSHAGRAKLARLSQEVVPIVVIASNRPHYLYRMLRSLLQAKGVQPSQIIVFIDGFYDEPKEVCKLFGLHFHQHRPQGSRSARISHHYKASLTRTFRDLFPVSGHAIIFEEDLDVAADALEYFDQTLPLLESDQSLYCISAWNDQGYEHSVRDPLQLMRIETMPGLGWLLSRRLFLDELEPNWPPSSQQHDWDMWIRTSAIRRGRECIIPEVSRTYHFGSTGTNINSYFQRQYFSKHAFSGNGGLSFGLGRNSEVVHFEDLDSLAAQKYERLIEALMSSPQRQLFSPTSLSTANETSRHLVVMSREALCSFADLTTSSSDAFYTHLQVERQSTNKKTQSNIEPNVIFIKMIDSDDFKNWLHLAKCWRLWDLDARGQHKSMWRLHLNGRPTFVVGHPASPYSKLKPVQLLPYDF